MVPDRPGVAPPEARVTDASVTDTLLPDTSTARRQPWSILITTVRRSPSHARRSVRWPGRGLLTRGLIVAVLALGGVTGIAAAADGSDASSQEYVVESGDTVLDIALRFGAEATEIANLNGLTDPDVIRVGQKLRVPAAQSVDDTRAQPTSRGRSTAMVWPLRGIITTVFGERGPYWVGGRHPGLDIAARIGSPIRAAGAGLVIESARSGYNSGYGNYVKIDHGGGTHTLYGHLSSVAVDPGDEVIAGDVVGAVGMTGLTTGPHLHFEVRVNGVRVDPEAYLP